MYRDFETDSKCRTRQYLKQCPPVLAMTQDVRISSLGRMLIVCNEPRSHSSYMPPDPHLPLLFWGSGQGLEIAGFHVLVSQTWPIMSRRA